jgi:hypothetical protein
MNAPARFDRTAQPSPPLEAAIAFARALARHDAERMMRGQMVESPERS